jgi:hypothetical protein
LASLLLRIEPNKIHYLQKEKREGAEIKMRKLQFLANFNMVRKVLLYPKFDNYHALPAPTFQVMFNSIHPTCGMGILSTFGPNWRFSVSIACHHLL